MGIPLTSIMVIFLQLNYIYGTYVFAKDVSQMMGFGATKKWLVFMEIRIKQCIKTRKIPYDPRVDLVGLIRCLVTRPMPQRRCYIYDRKWVVWFQKPYRVIIQGEHLVSKSWLNKCRNTSSLIVNAFVHGMFNIDVTFLYFVMLDVFYMYPPHNDCIESPATFKTDVNGTPHEYCGVHYPWSIYFPKNMVSLKLDMQYGRPYIFPGYIHIILEIGVVDKHIFHDQYGIHTGAMAWSDFKVQWYLINVDMLYRVMIRTVYTNKLKSILNIYDGPNENMPQLLNHQYQLNGTLLATTFQVFVIRVSKHNIKKSAITYKAIRDKQIMLKPSQQIFLRNNSGCGTKNTRTWMCTYHISSPAGTHAKLKIVSLDISGPYRNMYISAGVAIYNVINQDWSLVAHWHRSIDATDETLVITGTENELHMVVFSYSPFTVLSYHFGIDSSVCIGRFIGKFLRPSLLSVPHFSRSSILDNAREQIFIQFNVTRDCLAVQLMFLPVEYPVSDRLIAITFSYKQALHIWKYSVGIDHMIYTCQIYGDNDRVKGAFSFHTSVVEIIGLVDVINCWSASNSIITILQIHPNKCLMPCQAVSIPTVTANGIHESCNICTYEWIYKYEMYHFDYSPLYGSIEFEQIYGNISSLEICTQSASRSCCTDKVYCFFTFKVKFQFSERRAISVYVYSTDVWRTKRLADAEDAGGCQTDCEVPTENPGVFRFGAYEYIPRNTFQTTWLKLNWSSASYECRKNGAQLLTVFDRRELKFIIQNIMTPYKIEYVFIGIQRQVNDSV